MKLECKFFESKYTLATGTITVDDTFVISIVIRQSKSGNAFVAYPSAKKQDGTYRDVAYCLKREINDGILAKYDAWRREQSKQETPKGATILGSTVEII